MKKYRMSILALLLIISGGLKAQLIVNLQLLPEGMVRKNQLWNMTLVNNYSSTIEIKINMVMTELSTNQSVLSADTRFITVAPGIKQIIMNDLLPVSYNSLSSGYLIDQTPDGYLPVGRFKICYAFIASGESAHLAEECNVVDVSPLSPPQLISPFNGEEVETNNPVLTWAPPMPLNLFNNLTYDLSLVEILENQSVSDAIQKNMPLVMQRDIRSLMLQYPIASPQLLAGKKYAWQVFVKNNGTPVAGTEIWSFMVKSNTKLEAGGIYGNGFIRLKKSGETPYTVSHGTIKIEYNNEANDTAVQMQLSDLSGTSSEVRSSISNLPLTFGQNFIAIDLTKDFDLSNSHVYLLTITNSRKEKWALKFQFIKIK